MADARVYYRDDDWSVTSRNTNCGRRVMVRYKKQTSSFVQYRPFTPRGEWLAFELDIEEAPPVHVMTIVGMACSQEYYDGEMPLDYSI